MTTRRPAWHPRYTLTPVIARSLMEIEAARAAVEHMPLPPAVEAGLRRTRDLLLPRLVSGEVEV